MRKGTILRAMNTLDEHVSAREVLRRNGNSALSGAGIRWDFPIRVERVRIIGRAILSRKDTMTIPFLRAKRAG